MTDGIQRYSDSIYAKTGKEAPTCQKESGKKSVDGDGPLQARLQIPTGLVAEMGEKRVDAGQSFAGIDLVKFILVGTVFYFYGEKPVVSEVFEGNGDGSV